MKLTHLVLLSGGALVAAAGHHGHNHAHVHRHADSHGSPVEQRDEVTKVVQAPEVTEYVLNGKVLSLAEVLEGLKNSIYIILPDATTSTTSTSTSTTSTTSTTSSSVVAAEFFQKSTTSTTSSTSTTSTSTTPTPTPSTSSSSSSSSSSSATSEQKLSAAPAGLDAEFPSGTIPCSQFPSAYGAVPVDYLGLGGYTGIQQVPGWNLVSLISYISTAISGGRCSSLNFCSYACPAGYQKSQWPTLQGASGQSIGGLFCNAQGFLELNDGRAKQLCTAGVPGIFIQNKLSGSAALCRTDYPGTESETIPLNTNPGDTLAVTCPDANNYYTWQGSFTSAQYYLNNMGVSVSDACQWGDGSRTVGNWAPMNVGVGKGSSGEIFISIFPNTPTNPLSVTLNYNVAIVGDVSGDCKYVGGTYYNNGVASATGCTVSVHGQATFVLTN